MCEFNVILSQAMSPFRRACSVFPFRAHPIYYQGVYLRGMQSINDAQQSASSLYVQAIKHNVCICIYMYT